MRTILNNKRILVCRTIRQQNRTVRWQATKCNARERISKHKAFNQVSGTLAAGTMRKNIHHFKHSILHLGHSKTLYSFNKYRAGVDLRLNWHSSCESIFEASSARLHFVRACSCWSVKNVLLYKSEWQPSARARCSSLWFLHFFHMLHRKQLLMDTDQPKTTSQKKLENFKNKPFTAIISLPALIKTVLVQNAK